MSAMLRPTTVLTLYFSSEAIAKWMIDTWNKVKGPHVCLKDWCIMQRMGFSIDSDTMYEERKQNKLWEGRILGKYRL